jgi:hypothetical protein
MLAVASANAVKTATTPRAGALRLGLIGVAASFMLVTSVEGVTAR